MANEPQTVKPKKRPISAQMLGLLLASAIFTLYQIYLIYILTPVYNVSPRTDFNLFLMFGRLVLDGQTPYQGLSPFLYQLWVIFLYIPFAIFEKATAFVIWDTVNLVLLMLSVWLAQQTFLPKLATRWFLPLLCLALAISSNAIMSGHSTVIFLAALALSGYWIKQNRYYWAGLPIFTVLIKPQLTFLMGIAFLGLLFTPKRKQILLWLAGAATTSAILIIVSLILQPDWPLRLSQSFNPAQTNGEIGPDGIYREYFKTIFPSWLEFMFGLEQPLLGILSVIGLGSLLGVGGYRLWQWRNEPTIFMAIVIALNIAVTPYSHVYDFPPLILTVFVILQRIRQDWQADKFQPALIRAALLIFIFAIQPLSPDYRWFYGQVFVISWLVVSFSHEK